MYKHQLLIEIREYVKGEVDRILKFLFNSSSFFASINVLQFELTRFQYYNTEYQLFILDLFNTTLKFWRKHVTKAWDYFLHLNLFDLRICRFINEKVTVEITSP